MMDGWVMMAKWMMDGSVMMDGQMMAGWVDDDGWRCSSLRAPGHVSASAGHVWGLTRAGDGDLARQLGVLGFSGAQRVPDSDAGGS